jgi:hypothetical protein
MIWLIFIGLVFSSFNSDSFSDTAQAKKIGENTGRKVAFISDVDGTFLKNIRNIILFRTTTPSALGPNLESMPEIVRVPINDFEGNTGPQIRKRIGHLADNDRFIPSSSQTPITLSNGQIIVPAYYYKLDQQSYSELRTQPGVKFKNGSLAKALLAADSESRKYLLESAIFVSLAYSEQYQDLIHAFFLTMAGHDPEEMKYSFETLIRDRLNWGSRSLPKQAYPNLNHETFSEYGRSKISFIQSAYYQLTETVNQDRDHPHYLVIWENDRDWLREIDRKLQDMVMSGKFSYPVVPILINLVEPEVFNMPDGFSWTRNPDAVFQRMSRVTIYEPGKPLQRSDDLAHVLSLILAKPYKEASALLNKIVVPMPLCRNVFSESIVKR